MCLRGESLERDKVGGTLFRAGSYLLSLKEDSILTDPFTFGNFGGSSSMVQELVLEGSILSWFTHLSCIKEGMEGKA